MTFLQTLFPPKIDPQTTIELWSATLIESGGKYYGNLTLNQRSTWAQDGKYVLKQFDVPANIYGLSDPVIVVGLTVDTRSVVLLHTMADFKTTYGDLPVRTKDEAKEWEKQVIAKLELSILEIDLKILEGKLELAKLEVEICNEILSLAKDSNKK